MLVMVHVGGRGESAGALEQRSIYVMLTLMQTDEQACLYVAVSCASTDVRTRRGRGKGSPAKGGLLDACGRGCEDRGGARVRGKSKRKTRG